VSDAAFLIHNADSVLVVDPNAELTPLVRGWPIANRPQVANLPYIAAREERKMLI
jgi:hypothetical protein